jgi:cobalt-precorrin 5A hydrolase/precorrin-3B C17-methyltransferase
MRNNIHSENSVTPLCPAGHLPHKGGERQAAAVLFLGHNASLYSPPLWGRCHGVTEGGNALSTRGITP